MQPVALTGYASARDLFGAVREAAIEHDRLIRQRQRLESASVRVGGGITTATHGGAHDAMARADALVDFDASTRGRIDGDLALVNESTAVLYGRDNHGGIAVILGSQYADALLWYYCIAASWSTTADALGVGTSTAKRYAHVALETIDSLGIERVIAGDGGAEG